MAATIANFRVRFPEFGVIETAVGAVPDLRIQMYLDDAALYLAQYTTCLGARLDYVTYYLTAHYLSTNRQFDLVGNPITSIASNNGAIKKIKIDDIEKEYNYASSTTNGIVALLDSAYGKVVYDNIKSCPASLPITINVARGAVTI